MKDRLGKFRVILITQGVSRIVYPLIKANNDYEIVGMIEASRRKCSRAKSIIISLIDIFYLVFYSKHFSLKRLSRKQKIPYYQMTTSDDASLDKWIDSLCPDIFVVFSMPFLLKEHTYTKAKYGAINLHPSFLPSYRGPLPDFWMYYNTDLEPGVTVHYINEGEDLGDIIYQEKRQVPLGIKSKELLDLLIEGIGVNLLMKAIKGIQDKSAPRLEQSNISPTPRARRIKSSEHKNIIDWEKWPIERIWHLLRGTESWLDVLEQPAGIFKGQRWTITDYQRCDIDTKKYAAGQIFYEGSRYFVSCMEGKIFLKKNFSIKALLLQVWRWR